MALGTITAALLVSLPRSPHQPGAAPPLAPPSRLLRTWSARSTTPRLAARPQTDHEAFLQRMWRAGEGATCVAPEDNVPGYPELLVAKDGSESMDLERAAPAKIGSVAQDEEEDYEAIDLASLQDSGPGTVALLLIVGLGFHFSRNKRAASGDAASAAKPSAEVQITAGAAESEKAADKI